MKAPQYKKITSMLGGKKPGFNLKAMAKPMRKAAPGAVRSQKSISWKNPKYKPSSGKGVGY